MKKNKKNYISDLLDFDDMFEKIEDLLLYEKYIKYKKSHKLQLTHDEKFFDDYIVSPSLMINLLSRRLDKNEKL